MKIAFFHSQTLCPISSEELISIPSATRAAHAITFNALQSLGKPLTILTILDIVELEPVVEASTLKGPS